MICIPSLITLSIQPVCKNNCIVVITTDKMAIRRSIPINIRLHQIRPIVVFSEKSIYITSSEPF